MAKKKKLQTERDMSEFPRSEHLTLHGEALCGTEGDDIILLENTADNPPGGICMKCRRDLAQLAIYNWQEFCQVMVYEEIGPRVIRQIPVEFDFEKHSTDTRKALINQALDS